MTTLDYETLPTEEQSQTIDVTPKVRSPWRRFLARSFDFTLYGIFLMVIQAFVFNINVATRTSGGNILDTFIIYFLMVLIEPFLLAAFGTTPGKWLLGLYITDEAGEKISYSDALSRILTILWRGYGLNIPIYSLVRQWKSYKDCAAGETLDWEVDSIIHLKDEKKWRIASYATGYLVLFAVIILMAGLSTMAKNRGDITVTEFSENYNKFEEYYLFNQSKVLNDDGEWVKREQEGNVIYFGGNIEPPAFEYTEENGFMTGMRFSSEMVNSDTWIPSYSDEIVLSILAYVRAQENYSLFKNDEIDLIKRIQQVPFSNFKQTIHGVTITCEYTYSGYTGATSFGFLIPDNEVDTEKFYSIDFKMYKE